MLYSEFADFNQYKVSIDTKPICSYTNCEYSISVLNVTLDSALNDRVTFMAQAAQNGSSTSSILQSAGMQYLCELLRLLFQLSRQ